MDVERQDEEVASVLLPAPQSARGTATPQLGSAPRLRIAHIMLWTACTAAYLAVQRLWLPEGSSRVGEARLAFLAAFAFLAGPSLAALVLLPVWRRGGYRFPSYPGEWLLPISGACLVLMMLVSFVQRGLMGNLRTPSDLNYFESLERVFRILAALYGGAMMILAILSCLA